jgi:dienelactone hydrolase
MRNEKLKLVVDGRHLQATFVESAKKVPGILFVHGWGASQEQYTVPARKIAALGCICLTFNLSGNEAGDAHRQTVTREQNLQDVLAAYDWLTRRSDVESSAIAVVASSYGAYLAAITTSLRPVRWLALQAPALYKDADWDVPMQKLNRDELDIYRRELVSADQNRALSACATFEGHALIVESESDDTIPHAVITNYRTALEKVHSLTYRMIAGADHGLSQQQWQEAYMAVLVNWATETGLGDRR